jgi:hypothetical protein
VAGVLWPDLGEAPPGDIDRGSRIAQWRARRSFATRDCLRDAKRASVSVAVPAVRVQRRSRDAILIDAWREVGLDARNLSRASRLQP